MRRDNQLSAGIRHSLGREVLTTAPPKLLNLPLTVDVDSRYIPSIKGGYIPSPQGIPPLVT